MESFHNEYTDKLMDAILSLKTRKECYDFFEDLCTIKEILEMSKRFEAARLLNNGLSYKDIIKEIGLSTATLSRVSRALSFGAGGYKRMINKT